MYKDLAIHIDLNLKKRVNFSRFAPSVKCQMSYFLTSPIPCFSKSNPIESANRPFEFCVVRVRSVLCFVIVIPRLLLSKK